MSNDSAGEDAQPSPCYSTCRVPAIHHAKHDCLLSKGHEGAHKFKCDPAPSGEDTQVAQRLAKLITRHSNDAHDCGAWNEESDENYQAVLDRWMASRRELDNAIAASLVDTAHANGVRQGAEAERSRND